MLIRNQFFTSSVRILRNSYAQKIRYFSSSPVKPQEVSQGTKFKNFGVAGILVAFVAGVYYTSISKLKQTVNKIKFHRSL
jgi:hypothetical protein